MPTHQGTIEGEPVPRDFSNNPLGGGVENHILSEHGKTNLGSIKPQVHQVWKGSRRDFLKLAAITGAGLLEACSTTNPSSNNPPISIEDIWKDATGPGPQPETKPSDKLPAQPELGPQPDPNPLLTALLKYYEEHPQSPPNCTNNNYTDVTIENNPNISANKLEKTPVPSNSPQIAIVFATTWTMPQEAIPGILSKLPPDILLLTAETAEKVGMVTIFGFTIISGLALGVSTVTGATKQQIEGVDTLDIPLDPGNLVTLQRTVDMTKSDKVTDVFKLNVTNERDMRKAILYIREWTQNNIDKRGSLLLNEKGITMQADTKLKDNARVTIQKELMDAIDQIQKKIDKKGCGVDFKQYLINKLQRFVLFQRFMLSRSFNITFDQYSEMDIINLLASIEDDENMLKSCSENDDVLRNEISKIDIEAKAEALELLSKSNKSITGFMIEEYKYSMETTGPTKGLYNLNGRQLMENIRDFCDGFINVNLWIE